MVDLSGCPPHYWMIDSNNVGVCKYCGETRDFNKLQGHESALLGIGPRKTRRLGNPYGRRGRPRGKASNDSSPVVKRSDAAKKRWQDPEYRARHHAAMKKLWQDPGYRAGRKAAHLLPLGRHRERAES